MALPVLRRQGAGVCFSGHDKPPAPGIGHGGLPVLLFVFRCLACIGGGSHA